MESVRTVKGLNTEKGLDDKATSERCLPIHPAHQKCLKFQWQGSTWKFQSLPFGLSSAPYVFTKLMKPMVSTPVPSGGFRGVSEVSTECPFGLHLVLRSTDDRLSGNPLSGYKTKKTANLSIL